MTSQNPLVLDSLPEEIIRTIARATCPTDLIKLCSVNRALRSICWDPLIFRGIVEENQNKTPGSQKISDEPFDLNTLISLIPNITEAWARLAVADSLADTWTHWFFKVFLRLV